MLGGSTSPAPAPAPSQSAAPQGLSTLLYDKNGVDPKFGSTTKILFPTSGTLKPPTSEISPWITTALAQSSAENTSSVVPSIPSKIPDFKDIKTGIVKQQIEKTERELMPPPASSPNRIKISSPKRVQNNDKAIELLRMFIHACQSVGVPKGLNYEIREYTDKLRPVMSLEEYFRLKTKLSQAGFNTELGTVPSDGAKDALLKILYETLNEYGPPTTPVKTLSTITSIPTRSPEESYEMSDYSSSDSEDEDEPEDKPQKKIPRWAKKEVLDDALMKQQYADPDKIFPEVFSCNLDGTCDIIPLRFYWRFNGFAVVL
jgi:hypothetical protein